MRQHGYVLLLVLVLLALAAVAMAGVGRQVTRQSLEVLAAEEELQRRFGSLSCARVLLPQAERVLDYEDEVAAEAERDPVRWARREVRLGQMTFTLVLGDEQAKPNVNVLHERLGRSMAEEAVRRLARASRTEPTVRLRPLPVLADARTPHPATEAEAGSRDDDRRYAALDQVFALAGSPAGLAPTERQASGTSGGSGGTSGGGASGASGGGGGVTCWGDGRLHLRRATLADLREVLGDLLDGNQLEELVRLRREFPNMGAGSIVERLEMLDRQRDEVMGRLADRSACHSLWIVADTGQRLWYELAVIEQAAGVNGQSVRRWAQRW